MTPEKKVEPDDQERATPEAQADPDAEVSAEELLVEEDILPPRRVATKKEEKQLGELFSGQFWHDQYPIFQCPHCDYNSIGTSDNPGAADVEAHIRTRHARPPSLHPQGLVDAYGVPLLTEE